MARRLSVVIPAFNERKGLPVTLKALLETLPEAEIIVVDDGSADGTADTVRDFPNVACIRHTVNRGYGAALKSGVRFATREFVAWFDADNEHRPQDLKAMLERIAAADLVAVIAQRNLSGPSPLRNWGKACIRLLARTFNVNVGSDINCGLRIFRRDTFSQYLSLLPNGYSASITSTMIMLERGYPVGFYPVQLNQRIGQSKLELGDGFMALILVLRMVMLFAPLRIFLIMGLLLAVLGVVYGAGIAMYGGRGIPTASVLVILTGVLLAMFGLIADQISQMRIAQYDASTFRVIQPGMTTVHDKADNPR